MQTKKELKKIENLLGEELFTVLKELNCIIAGGALTSVFSNKEVNDIDVYFRKPEDFENLVKAIFNQEDTPDIIFEYIPSFGVVACHASSKALLVRVGKQEVQFITHKFYNNAWEIFDTFDFTINMAAWDLKDDSFYCREDFLKHLAQRHLHINEKTSYPLITCTRIQKYQDRGYSISKPQMLKILIAVNNLKIDSWEELIEQLGGMYGLRPDQIFDTTKKFSLEDAMKALDGVEFKGYEDNNVDGFESIVCEMPQNFSINTLKSILESLQNSLECLTYYSTEHTPGYFKVKSKIERLDKEINKRNNPDFVEEQPSDFPQWSQ